MGPRGLKRIIPAALCALTAALLLAVLLPASAGAEQAEQAEQAGQAAPVEHGTGWQPSPPGEYPQYVIDTTGRQYRSAVDLSSEMPPVGDQLDLNSCVAWSTGYYYKSWQEKQEHTAWNLTLPKYQYSPPFIFNQCNDGVNDGISFAGASGALTLLKNEGCVDLAEMPCIAGDYTTQPTAAQSQAALPYRISDSSSFFVRPTAPPLSGYVTPTDITPLKAQLDAGEPFVVGFQVYSDFPDYNGNPDDPFYDKETLATKISGHAMCIVGYDDNADPLGADDDHKGGFLAVNSWGADWNDTTTRPGYVYLSYDFMKRYVMEAWQMDDITPDTPHIDSISPDHGGAGTSVQIDGYNFGTERGAAKVTIDGADATVSSWNDTRIIVTSPTPTTSGSLIVYDWDGAASNSKAFHAAPTLASLDKGSGVTGDSVTLTGTEFGTARGTSYVSFGSAPATVYTQWTETAITCEVPAAAGGLLDVTVTTSGGTSAGLAFSVIPTLDTLKPLEGAPGTEVTLSGTGFGAGQGSFSVMFDEVPATQYNLWSENEIKCLVPKDAAGVKAVLVRTTGGDTTTISFSTTLPAVTWYLAEGCTDGGMETWVLVQNPETADVTVDLTLMTDEGEQKPSSLQGVVIKGKSRMTFNLNNYVTTYNVSTRVEAANNVVCERAMYGNGRAWAHESIGATATSSTWYLAEGCTDGGMETWVLVQNPNDTAVTVTLELQDVAGGGAVLADVPIEANSRRSFNLGESLTSYNVSTMVTSQGGNVVCERAMYGNSGAWAHDSVGAKVASDTWYLAEGCTDGGFETWVLVQNPGTVPVEVDLELQTEDGSQAPDKLQNVIIAPRTRQSFNLGDYVTTYNVSTRVTSTGGGVVCERAMYGNSGAWAHESVGAMEPSSTWLMAEGCTAGGMETWVLVQNPNATEVTVTFTLMTDNGPVYPPGLGGVIVPANSRLSFDLGYYAVTYNVSTRVVSEGGAVVCERAMYGNGRTWADDSTGYAP